MDYSERPFLKIGRLIRNLRIAAGLAQHELAQEIDINNSYLSRIENGERRPSPKIMKRMAAVLPTTYEDLVAASGLISEDFTIVPKSDGEKRDISRSIEELREILAQIERKPLGEVLHGRLDPSKIVRRGAPVFSKVPAGFFDDMNVVHEYDDYEQLVLAEDELGYDPKAFALRVKGDSMVEAGIFEDDIVIVSPNTKVANGDIAAVKYGRAEITLKRFYMDGETIILQPCNSKFRPITFSNPEDVTVLGKVILVRRKLY
ncbi:MAG: helix-turn-helix domain-containing protein [bacterium]